MERPKYLRVLPPLESAPGGQSVSTIRHENAVAFVNKLKIRTYSKLLTLDQANAMWSAEGASDADQAISRSRMLEADFIESYSSARAKIASEQPHNQHLLVPKIPA